MPRPPDFVPIPAHCGEAQSGWAKSARGSIWLGEIRPRLNLAGRNPAGALDELAGASEELAGAPLVLLGASGRLPGASEGTAYGQTDRHTETPLYSTGLHPQKSRKSDEGVVAGFK